jgi:NADPH-dependent glutamate synthase beta subunit-like oxidoreductase
MNRTDTSDPNYYHKVVDCQWACPAHTNVPEYIRMIAQGRFDDAYIVNRESNVFPGILGRTCDRPCEPACRRGRIDGKPVAICRLKRVAADHKNDITARLPKVPTAKNGKKVALIGAGPAALTVANDLMPLGYQCTIFEKGPRPGGLMRVNIPAFRLPEEVLDEEIGYIVNMGVTMKYDSPVTRSSTRCSSAPARRRAKSSTCRDAATPIRSSSASSGSSRSISDTSTRSASGC